MMHIAKGNVEGRKIKMLDAAGYHTIIVKILMIPFIELKRKIL